jgi:hypothetical protein
MLANALALLPSRICLQIFVDVTKHLIEARKLTRFCFFCFLFFLNLILMDPIMGPARLHVTPCDLINGMQRVFCADTTQYIPGE